MTVIEGNKLIAEFMGVKFHPIDNYYYYGELMNTIPMLEPNVWRLSSDQLKYHSSWDWLMPSWGKLSSILLTKGLFDIIEEFKNAVVKNDINTSWEVAIKGIKLVNE